MLHKHDEESQKEEGKVDFPFEIPLSSAVQPPKYQLGQCFSPLELKNCFEVLENVTGVEGGLQKLGRGSEEAMGPHRSGKNGNLLSSETLCLGVWNVMCPGQILYSEKYVACWGPEFRILHTDCQN